MQESTTGRRARDSVANVNGIPASDLLARDHFAADCDRCAGLCCVALAFTRSTDFAFDKHAGQECVHLGENGGTDDFRCSIHPHLRERGMRGCTVFDCLGAGPRLTARAGNWRTHSDSGAAMFAAFPVLRQLHELEWYLVEAERRVESATLRHECLTALNETEGFVERVLATSGSGPAQVDTHQVDDRRSAIAALLGRVSESIRGATPTLGPRLVAGGDLIGAKLAGRDLSRANLRGAYLIAADLTGARLDLTDLIGADLRDTRLHGADLSRALFVTQPQINAAAGDSATRIPERLVRPSHWG